MSSTQPRRVQWAAGVVAVATSVGAVACSSDKPDTSATTGPAAATTATPTTADPTTTSNSPPTTEQPTTSAPTASTRPPSTGPPGEASYATGTVPEPDRSGGPANRPGAGVRVRLPDGAGEPQSP